MPRYQRAFAPGGTFFFTVALLDRRQRMLVDRIDALREAFRLVRAQQPFSIDAIVVLPDHLHCIWTLPRDDPDFSTRWRLIETRFAQAIPTGKPSSARRARAGERGIWQRRFWEHVIRDDGDFESHADYIHFNPVKHGHAERPVDWPYSSFHRFAARGLYPRDWAAGPVVEALEYE